MFTSRILLVRYDHPILMMKMTVVTTLDMFQARLLSMYTKPDFPACLFDHMQRTPLHYAAMKDHSEIVRCLVEQGANVDIKDKNEVHTISEPWQVISK